MWDDFPVFKTNIYIGCFIFISKKSKKSKKGKRSKKSKKKSDVRLNGKKETKRKNSLF